MPIFTHLDNLRINHHKLDASLARLGDNRNVLTLQECAEECPHIQTVISLSDKQLELLKKLLNGETKTGVSSYRE